MKNSLSFLGDSALSEKEADFDIRNVEWKPNKSGEFNLSSRQREENLKNDHCVSGETFSQSNKSIAYKDVLSPDNPHAITNRSSCPVNKVTS